MSFVDNIMNFFSLDDEDDGYDDDFYDDEETNYNPSKRKASAEVSAPEKENRIAKAQRPVREPRTERATKNKVIPIRKTNGGFEVCIVRPSDKDEAQDACAMLLNNCAVVVNLEGLDLAKSQGIVDFISGCLYAIDGNMQSISKYILVCTPSDIDISGESLSELASGTEDPYSINLDQDF